MTELQVNLESGGDKAIALAQAREALLADSRQEGEDPVRIKPERGGGLWSVARQAYRMVGVTNPEPTDLKALALDIASRNNISMDATLDPKQSLWVKLPGKAIETEAARVSQPQPVPPKVEVDRPTCSSTWEEVNMIANWVTHNEAGIKSYRAYNPDDNGAGISVGLMQWNQKRGDLPVLVDAWFDKNPHKFSAIFGRNAANIRDEDWLRKVDFSGNETLRGSMQEALADPEFQGVQLHLRNDHIEESCEVAKDYGFSSLRARAVVADLVNQLGKQGARSFISKVPRSAGNESQRIEKLKQVTDDRINARDRIEAIEAQVRKIWRLEAVAKN